MKKVSERIVNKIKAAIEDYNTTAARFAQQSEVDEMQQKAFDSLTRKNNDRVAFIASLTDERDEAGAYIVTQEQYDEVDNLTY